MLIYSVYYQTRDLLTPPKMNPPPINQMKTTTKWNGHIKKHWQTMHRYTSSLKVNGHIGVIKPTN
eukprot:scaffold161819_cov17-Cyclotella_meneghiniana.AAC.1